MKAAAIALSLAFLALRFFEPGLAPFVFDEPFFQILIDWHMGNHAFPASSIPGNAGIPYGPTALWFYGLIRQFTPRIEILVLCHAALSTCGVIMLASLLRRHFGRGAALLALLLMAASPLLYFYSRMLWDNSITIPLTAALLSLTLSLVRRRSAALCVGWGLVAALLFNLHLMNTAIIGACALYLLVAGRGRGGTLKFVMLSAMPFLAVSSAYLSRIIAALGNLKSVNGAGGTGSAFHLNRLAAPLSTQVMSYFYQPVLAEVLPHPLDPGLWLLVACFAVLVLRRSFPPALQLISAAMAATLALHFTMGVDISHPHYFNPVWASGFVAVAAAWHAAGAVRWQRALLGCLAALTLASQGYTTISALHAVKRDLGTREMHYGTAVSEQRRFMEEACRSAGKGRDSQGPNIDLSGLGSVFPYSMQYHAAHAVQCRGQTVTFNPGSGLRASFGDTTPTFAGLKID